MKGTAGKEILAQLRREPPGRLSPRPKLPPPRETFYDQGRMIERFTEELKGQTGVVHRVRDQAAVLECLAEIVNSEGLKTVMAATDGIIASLDLVSWGKERGLSVRTVGDYDSREAYKKAVFEEAEAGITGADFAVAESGTLVLLHSGNQPRLVSLAPILHIAVTTVDRLFPTYEDVIEKIFGGPEKIPAQVSLITGPSMTADIQARPFKGMHGPRRLVVILAG